MEMLREWMILMNWIQPMEPILSADIITGDDWIHQVKWDGIRGLTYVIDGEIRIYTKNRRERTVFYPELQHLTKLITKQNLVLDGELIVFNKEGRPSFQRALTREKLKTLKNVSYYQRHFPVTYVVFDLLSYDNRDLTKYSFKERKELLRESLKQDQTIAITDDFYDGKKLYQMMREKEWEGIVSKKTDSLYYPGKKHKAWYKTKLLKKVLAIVCGIQWKDDYPNSLLLGVYREEGNLHYIGKASIGLSQQDYLLLKEYSKQLGQSQSPFNLIFKTNHVTWIKPALTCWIEFLEWTEEGHLRHPKIVGFSDIAADEANGKEVLE